jgi:Flp pilus assembly protein CpaB
MIRPHTRRAFRLAVARHRRLAVAGCVAGAVAAGIHAVSPAPPPTRTVWVAADDLPAGRMLASGDLVAARWPRESSPPATLDADQAAGRSLATPMRRGEPLTDVRVAGPGLLAGQPAGTLAATVPLAGAAAATLVRAGDVVDVLAAAAPGLDVGDGTSTSTPADVIARRVLVLAVLPGQADGGGLLGGASGGVSDSGDQALVVAADEPTARSLGGAGGRELSVVVRAP